MLFQRYDSHLNEIGGYLEYKVLISEIQKNFPEIKPLKIEDFTIKRYEKSDGDCIKTSPLFKNLQFKESVPCLNMINKTRIEVELVKPNHNNYYTIFKYKNFDITKTRNAVLIGDSFQNNYREYLASHFKNFNSLYVTSGKNFVLDEKTKQALFSEKTDIVIIETTERFLQRLLYLESFYDIADDKYRE